MTCVAWNEGGFVSFTQTSQMSQCTISLSSCGSTILKHSSANSVKIGICMAWPRSFPGSFEESISLIISLKCLLHNMLCNSCEWPEKEKKNQINLNFWQSSSLEFLHSTEWQVMERKSTFPVRMYVSGTPVCPPKNSSGENVISMLMMCFLSQYANVCQSIFNQH